MLDPAWLTERQSAFLKTAMLHSGVFVGRQYAKFAGVVEFRLDGRPVVGLHFGGLKRAQNFAHSIARIEDVLVQHGATLQDS